MQNKIFIYRSINKQKHTQYCTLYGFPCSWEKQEKVKQRKDCSQKKFGNSFVKFQKWHPSTNQGNERKEKARHTRTQPRQLVSSFCFFLKSFSCKHSLFCSKSHRIGSNHKKYVIVNTCYDDTRMTSPTSTSSAQRKKKPNKQKTLHRFGENWVQVPLMFTMLVKMELLQKTRCYCVCVKVNDNILVGFLMFFFFLLLSGNNFSGKIMAN